MSKAFVRALGFRDLLELKISLANFAAHDLLDYFSDMVDRPDKFLNEVRFSKLFSYNKCFTASQENVEKTRRWMRITTTLTKYEAHVCMKYYDFGVHRRILDVGGNSGEFVLQVCRKYQEISAVVFDLPLVCDIGQQHISTEREADRISFIKGNAITDSLPRNFDLVVFKSMLHDWPEKEAGQFISKADQALLPGGNLLIFERGPMESDEAARSYASIPMLLFFNSFRPPEFYMEQMETLKFQDISIKEMRLDTPFYLITAKKPC